MKRLLLGFSFFWLFFVCLFICVPSAFTTFDPYAQSVEQVLQAPSAEHWFGTDSLGRDLYSRIIIGGRTSMMFSIGAMLVCVCLAFLYGGGAALLGGFVDTSLMRFLEVLIAMPNLILVILLMVFFDQNPFFEHGDLTRALALFLALSLTSWFVMARWIHEQVRKLYVQDFIESSRALGATEGRILFSHIWPHLRGPLLVYAVMSIPNLIFYESFLGFIGLGLQSPTISWGLLVNEGWRYLGPSPHMILFPSFFVFLTLLALSICAEYLRERWQ